MFMIFSAKSKLINSKWIFNIFNYILYFRIFTIASLINIC